jgi:hypothetical protein
MTIVSTLCANLLQCTSKAVVAEWLRRLTRNQFPSGSAGSNPADCDTIFSSLPTFLIAGTAVPGLRRHDGHSIVGSVVECSPATRAARVRFPDDADIFFRMPLVTCLQYHWRRRVSIPVPLTC